jgi:antitoxin HicB
METMIEYPARFTREKEGGFSVVFPDLPGCITEGDSMEEAMANAREALTGYLESIDSRSLKIPLPSALKGRGIRLIAPEKTVAFAIGLKALRKEKGLNQKQVAERIGIAYQTYQRFEDPVKANPTLKSIERLEKVFGLDLIKL